METNNRRKDAAVDSILDELKARGAAPPSTGSTKASVDDILAELGRVPAAVGVPGKGPSFSAQQNTQAAVGQAAAQTPAGQAGVQHSGTGAVPGKGPGFSAQQNTQAAVGQAAASITAGMGEQPAAQPQQKTKRIDLEATIWDIETQRSEPMPRLGKAAALDKVEPGKYAGESEFLSWFSSGDGNIPASKKEVKQAEKQEKRRLAAEKRAQKQQGKKILPDDLEGEGQEDFGEGPKETFGHETKQPFGDDIQPEFGDSQKKDFGDDRQEFFGDAQKAYADENRQAKHILKEEKYVLEEEKQAGHKAQKDAISEEIEEESTAFDDTAPGWEPDDGFFTAPQPIHTAPFTAIHPGQLAYAKQHTQQLGNAKQATKMFGTHSGGNSADEPVDTLSFNPAKPEEIQRTPTAAYTQEFEGGAGAQSGEKSLFVDEMVDERFRDFFSETVMVDPTELKQAQDEQKEKRAKRRKKARSAILTGEFSKLAEQAEQAERAQEENLELEDEFADYDRPQDAQVVEGDIAHLRRTLTRRTVASLFIGLVLFWFGFSFAGILPLPSAVSYAASPQVFAGIYLALVLVCIAINFTTVATGLVGLVSQPTVDSPTALASLAALLQGVLLLVESLGENLLPQASLFGGVLALMLAFNAFGKRVRAVSIQRNFRLASGGFNHSAAYVLGSGTDLTYNITKGLEEEYPSLLVSRPTALVKGFLRQSFSQRVADSRARIVGWALLAAAVIAAGLSWWLSRSLFLSISAFAGAFCISAPFSSSLVSGIPSLLLQQAAGRVGAVVPGWSAIEELGEVNVVMAGAKDIFPPSCVFLKGIKTFEKERIDLAILYAASVLVEGCDTLRDIFLGVIQGKSEMLYKVESLTQEPGRGFTAWVENSRVVIGSREMLQKHDIEPPAIEVEVKFVPQGHMPVYLAVSGKLFAMFIVGYKGDAQVQQTLNSLVKSGVSLLIKSDDMNINEELIEGAYTLAPGVVKVLGKRELDILEPLTSYLPESEGVMTHMGSFTSFIGGMRAAASCAASEKRTNIVQIASAALACVLCLLLAFSGGLPTLSVLIVLLYQLGWTVLISILPFAAKY